MSQHTSAVSLAGWPVAILAGGLATRLKPITENVPKALLDVAGEPFIAHQLRLLSNAGFREVVLCLGYLGELIEAFVTDGSRFGLKVNYVFDGKRLRGTGGALKHALGYLGDRFAVLYGDSYLPVDYQKVIDAFAGSAKPALMTVFKNNDLWDKSNVLFESGEIRAYSKTAPTSEMQHIDYGLAVLQSDVFKTFSGSEVFDLADLYSHLVAEKRMAGYEVTERFYEIGSTTGLEELDCLLRKAPVTIRE